MGLMLWESRWLKSYSQLKPECAFAKIKYGQLKKSGNPSQKTPGITFAQNDRKVCSKCTSKHMSADFLPLFYIPNYLFPRCFLIYNQTISSFHFPMQKLGAIPLAWVLFNGLIKQSRNDNQKTASCFQIPAVCMRTCMHSTCKQACIHLLFRKPAC